MTTNALVPFSGGGSSGTFLPQFYLPRRHLTQAEHWRGYAQKPACSKDHLRFCGTYGSEGTLLAQVYKKGTYIDIKKSATYRSKNKKKKGYQPLYEDRDRRTGVIKPPTASVHKRCEIKRSAFRPPDIDVKLNKNC